MFKLKLFPEDFFNICIKRKVEIKKLDKLPKLDNNYLLFITKYQEVEIIPDISLFNYKEALNENRYLECNYPEISRCFWSVGQAGQGDGWFLNKIDNTRDRFLTIYPVGFVIQRFRIPIRCRRDTYG